MAKIRVRNIKFLQKAEDPRTLLEWVGVVDNFPFELTEKEKRLFNEVLLLELGEFLLSNLPFTLSQSFETDLRKLSDREGPSESEVFSLTMLYLGMIPKVEERLRAHFKNVLVDILNELVKAHE